MFYFAALIMKSNIFRYNLTDQERNETLTIINQGTDDEYIEIHGSYSFIDGLKRYMVEYVADKNGYKPKVSQIVELMLMPIVFSSSPIATLRSAKINHAGKIVELDDTIIKSLVG